MTMRRASRPPFPRHVVLIAALCLWGSVQAADGFALGTGVDYSSGKYGGEVTTEILAVPVTATWTRGAFSARVSVPWLYVTGDPDVLPGVGGVDNGNPFGRGRLPLLGDPAQTDEPERGTASGMGDVDAALTWSTALGDNAGLAVGVNAKFATADEDQGLGTGANDYGASLDLYRDFSGTTVFGGVGHARLGDSPYIDLDQVNNASVGVSQALGRGQIGTLYEHRTASSSGRDDRRDATLFYAVPTASGGRFQVYASHGFSDGGPDWGAGVAISSGF